MREDRLWSPQMRKWMGDSRSHGQRIVMTRGASVIVNALINDDQSDPSFGAFLQSETTNGILVP